MKYKLLTLALAMTVAGMAQVRQETNLDKWDFSQWQHLGTSRRASRLGYQRPV